MEMAGCPPVASCRENGYSLISDEEIDADYFVRFYTDMFGGNIIPFPFAASVKQRLDNIKAIEKDIEKRLDVTLTHIPPEEIIEKRPFAVRDLHELMRAIDKARLSHDSFNQPTELPRRMSQCDYPIVESSTSCVHSKLNVSSPPFTPFKDKSLEIVKTPTPKSMTDSGVVTAAQKAVDLNQSLQSNGTLSRLSNQIWEAKTKAALLYELTQKELGENWGPYLMELRENLVSLEEKISSAITAIDRLTPDAQFNSDATTAQSLPSEYDEYANLDHELRRVIQKKNMMMAEGFIHCAKEFKKSMLSISGRKAL